MTTRKGRPPRRTATRKATHLTVVDEPWVMNPESLEAVPAEQREIVRQVTDALVTGLRGVRGPLEAELVLSNVFAAVATDAPADADDADREAMLLTLLAQVIATAEAAGTTSASGLVQVCATLGPEPARVAAAAAAQRLAAAGVTPPAWAAELGAPQLLRAWRQADVMEAQENIGLLFSYRGREHAIVVLVDNMLGGGVKDVWVAEGRQATRMRTTFAQATAGNPMATFEDLDERQVAERLTRVLERRPIPDQPDQVADVGRFLHLLESRVALLRRSTGMPEPGPADPALGQGEVLQLEVVLRYSDPPIRRRLEVPATTTLEQLHHVLQIAFDWNGDHPHAFEVGGGDLGWRSVRGAAARTTTLAQVAGEPGAGLLYRYDFGDNWEHDVTVEARRPAADGVRYPRLLDGDRAAPPEDSGGVPGYEELLEALRDPAHPEHLDRLEWAGGPIDPEAFDAAAVDRRLAVLAR